MFVVGNKLVVIVLDNFCGIRNKVNRFDVGFVMF